MIARDTPTESQAGRATNGEAGHSSGDGGARHGDGGEPNGDAAHPTVRILADSVSDFSLVQGEHGWYYGYIDGAAGEFVEMTTQSVVQAYVPPSGDIWECWATAPGQYWTQLFRLGGHANGEDTSAGRTPVLQLAVRRWVSTVAGQVLITGELAKVDVELGSNGVDARVLIDGREIYTAFVGGQDAGGLVYRIPASVNVGSTIDFVLDPHDSSDHHDLTRFTSVIHR
jgi:hypothetical protein